MHPMRIKLSNVPAGIDPVAWLAEVMDAPKDAIAAVLAADRSRKRSILGVPGGVISADASSVTCEPFAGDPSHKGAIGMALGTLSAVVAGIASGGPLMATEEEYQRRLAVCEACPWLDDQKRCKKCSCYTRVKAHLDAAKCPLAKW